MPYQKVFTLELIATVEDQEPLKMVTEENVVDRLNAIGAEGERYALGRLSFAVRSKPEPSDTISERLVRIEDKLDRWIGDPDEPVPLAHITTVNARWLQEAHCPCCGEGGFQPEADKCGVAGAVVLSNLRGFCSVCTQVWQCRCGEFINGESAAAHECDWSTAR